MASPVKRILRSPATMIGLVLLTAHLFAAVFSPWITPYTATELVGMPFEPPSAEFWLGTDILGRDYLTRLLMGGRITIGVALVGVTLAIIMGAILGLIAAWHRGYIEEIIMRLVDTKVAIPSILLVAIVVTGFGQSTGVLMVVIALIYTPGVIRTVRAQAIVISSQSFITAALLRGESSRSIIVRELFPNILDLLCVEIAIRLSSAILLVSSLSFLGLGISPPTADWGLMVFEGVGYVHTDPWLVIYPSVALSTLIVALNLVTEGVASAFGISSARRMVKG